MTDNATRVKILRESGDVKRCHIIPHHGQYDVARHSYGVACLITVLHPNPSAQLLMAALTHDAAERWTGDIPSPFKSSMGDIGTEVEVAVAEALDLNLDLYLDATDRLWVKACDQLDLLLWAFDQRKNGNTRVDQMISVTESKLYRSRDCGMLPDPLYEVLQSFGSSRLDELMFIGD